MTTWVNGRPCTHIDARDRGLQYGDGLFETMRALRGKIRLLDHHLERLEAGCRRLAIAGVATPRLRGELARIAARRGAGVLKLIVTRGPGRRGYQPTGRERCTRIITHHVVPGRSSAEDAEPVRVRL